MFKKVVKAVVWTAVFPFALAAALAARLWSALAPARGSGARRAVEHNLDAVEALQADRSRNVITGPGLARWREVREVLSKRIEELLDHPDGFRGRRWLVRRWRSLEEECAAVDAAEERVEAKRLTEPYSFDKEEPAYRPKADPKTIN